MKLFKRNLTTAMFLLCLPFSSMAAQMPSYYPSSFENVGVIQNINQDTGAVVVRNNALYLSPSVKVRSLKKRYASKKVLQPGMNIGFSLGSGSGAQAISEIWVLPPDYFLD